MPFDPRDDQNRQEPTRDQIERGREGLSSVYRADVEPGRARYEALIDERTSRGFGAGTLGILGAGLAAALGAKFIPPHVWKRLEGKLAKGAYDVVSRNKAVAKNFLRADPNDFTLLRELNNIGNILETPGIADEIKHAMAKDLRAAFKQPQVAGQGLENMTLSKLLRLQSHGSPVKEAITRGRISNIAVNLGMSEKEVFELAEPHMFHKGKLTDLSDVLNFKKIMPSEIFKKGARKLAEFQIPVIGLRPFGTLLPGSALEGTPLVTHFRDPVTLAKFAKESDLGIIHTRGHGTFAFGFGESRRLKDMVLTTSSGMAHANLIRNLSKTQLRTFQKEGLIQTRQPTFYEKFFFMGQESAGTGVHGFFQRIAKKLSPSTFLGVEGKAARTKFGGLLSEDIPVGAMHLVEKDKRWRDMLTAMADTPRRGLFQPLLGWDVGPGKGPVRTLVRTALGYGLPVWGGVQAARYLDFITGEVTGYKPSEAVADLYTSGRLLQKSLMDAVGITSGAKMLEQEFPGILDSPLGKALRSVSLIAGGAIAGKKLLKFNPPGKGKVVEFFRRSQEFNRAGAVTGAAVGALAAGFWFPDIAEDREELEQLYRGTKRVPLRKGQGWFLGRDPYEGGRITHFTPSWYREIKTDYRKKALYGSAENYWAHGTLFPTPHNVMGLKPFFDPYFLERRHYFDRPYPVTAGFGEGVPFVGPMFASTVGQLIKPSIERPLPLAGPATEGFMPGYGGGTAMITPGERGFSGIGTTSAERIGYGPASYLSPVNIKDPNSLSASAGLMITDLENLIGLRGFYSEQLRTMLGGERTPFQGRFQMASSSAMASFNRYYFDTEAFGGGLGFTEPLRRFLRRPSFRDTYNPLPNTMPDWLPGIRSTYRADQDNFIDFHSGDPYTKVREGEARLPGPGYEALYRLHGRSQYDMVDQFFVLADVAPYSQAFRIAKSEIEGMITRGEIAEPYYLERYLNSMQEIEARRNRINAKEDEEAKESAYIQAEVAEILSPTSFRTRDGVVVEMANTTSMPEQAARMMLEDANTRTQMQGEINEGGPVLRRLEKSRNDMMKFMQTQIGKQVTLRVAKDEDARYEHGVMQATWAKYSELSEKLSIPLAEREPFYDPTVAGDVYRTLGGMVGEAGFVSGLALGALMPKVKTMGGRVWSAATSAFIGALTGGLVEQKFTGNYTPADHYEHFNLRSTNFAGWDRPFENFIRGWWHEGLGKVFGEGYVPGYREEQREIEAYYDLLKYEKYARLEQQASAAGMREEAQKFGRQKRSTMIYMTGVENLSINTPGLKAALPGSEREYFYQFAQAKSNSERLKIIHSVSQDTARIMLSIWKNQLGEAREFANAQLQGYYDSLVRERLDMSSDQYASQVAEQLSIAFPESQHPIWHPNIPTQRFKYNYLQNEGFDIHQFGLWENQAPLPTIMTDVPDMSAATIGYRGTRVPNAASFRRTGDDYQTTHTGTIPSLNRIQYQWDGRSIFTDWRRRRSTTGVGLY